MQHAESRVRARALRAAVKSHGMRSLAITAALAGALGALAQPAYADDTTYTLYPTPQKTVYGDEAVDLESTADVLLESGIDTDTAARLDKALGVKGIKKHQVETMPTDGGTDVLVGIYDSNGPVDTYVKDLVTAKKLSYQDDLFKKTDAYMLAIVPGEAAGDADRIVVLGRDTDAAFYGLTTLYQLFQELDGSDVRELTMSDWADVVSRGFIEGYYGSPWSVEDRCDLMRWGGEHKLNAYVYAPKDDPKHRVKWRTPYTEDEIEHMIKPLAQAGNESKCRFVYALLPFYTPGDGWDGKTEEDFPSGVDKAFDFSDYDHDFAVLKSRYLQVIDAGVRQIALLSDDAADKGDDNYLRLLKDLTTWLHELQQEKNSDGSLKYPGLKVTLPYVPALWSYTGTGEAWYADAPENVQFVMTGNQTFGSVNHRFIDKFHKDSGGRTPFMWINWPCTDPLPNYLTMGGHNTFLETGVAPGSVDGIMLNPMQQTEPSKQGIFMVSDYAWNLWESTEHANQAWEDSISFMENNSPVDTTASRALRELFQHMRMSTAGTTGANDPKPDYAETVDGKKMSFWSNDESVDYTGATDPAGDMDRLLKAAQNGSISSEDTAAVRPTFERIAKAANDYERFHTNERMWNQIKPFVETLRDMANAALGYLDTIDLSLSGNKNANQACRSTFAQAEKHYFASSTHTFDVLGKATVAKAGHEHFARALEAVRAYAHNVLPVPDTSGYKTTTEGCEAYFESHNDPKALFDGRDDTFYWVHSTPSATNAGATVTVTFPQVKEITKIRFKQAQADQSEGGGDYMNEGDIEYQNEQGDWVTAGHIGGRIESNIAVAGKDGTPVKAKAIRVKNATTKNVWWKIYDLSASIAGENSVSAEELRSMVDAAGSVDTSAWTARAVERLKAARDAAQSALDGVEGAPSIDDAAVELAGALQGEERYTEKTLDQVQAAHISNESGVYTAGSYALYQDAYDAFVERLSHAENLPRREGEIYAAALAQATDDLVKAPVAPVDKSALEAEIGAARKLNEADFTPASWKALSSALTNAEAVFANNKATTQDVANATETLKAAREALIRRADKTALQQAVAEAKKLDQSAYTAESWKAFADTLAAASTVLDNVDATQADTDAALDALQAAIKALVKTQPWTDLNPSSPIKPNQGRPDTNKPSDNKGASGDKLAQTGDPSLIAGLTTAGAAAMSLLSGVALKKRRK